MTATVVLVHGAASGAYVWRFVAERLREAGVPSRAVELPSSVEGPGPPLDLRADVAVLGAMLDSIEGEVVVAAHSYGGMPVSEAAAGRSDVRRVVYVAALMPDVGDLPAEMLTRHDVDGGDDGVIVHPDGTYEDPPRADDDILPGCGPEVVQWYRDHAGRRSLLDLSLQTVEAAAWRDVGSTYVVATADRVLSPLTQRELAERADEVVEVDSPHLVPLVRPAELAALLARHAREG